MQVNQPILYVISGIGLHIHNPLNIPSSCLSLLNNKVTTLWLEIHKQLEGQDLVKYCHEAIINIFHK